MNVVRSRVIMMFAMILTLFSLLLPIRPAAAASGVVLFTPYTGLSVTPGETIDYTVNVINNGSNIENVTFSFDHLPKEWSTSMTAEGRTIEQLSVRGGKEEEVTLEVTVPLDADKGIIVFPLSRKGKAASPNCPCLSA
nr:NEW3 domain-containing protein [Geobacillus sp. JS12]